MTFVVYFLSPRAYVCATVYLLIGFVFVDFVGNGIFLCLHVNGSNSCAFRKQ